MTEKRPTNGTQKEGGAMEPGRSLATSFDLTKPVILLVTRNGHLTEVVMDYGLKVTERLDHRLMVAYVNTMPLLWDGGQRNHHFALAVNESITYLKEKAQRRGVIVHCIKETGNIGKVISRLCRIVKKIEFIIIDRGIKMEGAISRAPVPVFNVFSSEIIQHDPQI